MNLDFYIQRDMNMKKALDTLRRPRSPRRTGGIDAAEQITSETGTTEQPPEDSPTREGIITPTNAQEDLKKILPLGKKILFLGFEFLCCALRDTEGLPETSIQKLREKEPEYKNLLNTRSGQLLYFLTQTPAFCELFKEETEQATSPRNLEAKRLADQATQRRNLNKRHNEVCANIFLNDKHQPCIPRVLVEKLPHCTSNEHYLYQDASGTFITQSGIHGVFRQEANILEPFVEMHALMVEMAKTFLVSEEIYQLSQENGEVFSCDDSKKEILSLIETLKSLCLAFSASRKKISTPVSARIKGFKSKEVTQVTGDKAWVINVQQCYAEKKQEQLGQAIQDCSQLAESLKAKVSMILTAEPTKNGKDDPRKKFAVTTAKLNDHINKLINRRPPPPAASPILPVQPESVSNTSTRSGRPDSSSGWTRAQPQNQGQPASDKLTSNGQTSSAKATGTVTAQPLANRPRALSQPALPKTTPKSVSDAPPSQGAQQPLSSAASAKILPTPAPRNASTEKTVSSNAHKTTTQTPPASQGDQLTSSAKTIPTPAPRHTSTEKSVSSDIHKTSAQTAPAPKDEQPAINPAKTVPTQSNTVSAEPTALSKRRASQPALLRTSPSQPAPLTPTTEAPAVDKAQPTPPPRKESSASTTVTSPNIARARPEPVTTKTNATTPTTAVSPKLPRAQPAPTPRETTTAESPRRVEVSAPVITASPPQNDELSTNVKIVLQPASEVKNTDVTPKESRTILATSATVMIETTKVVVTKAKKEEDMLPVLPIPAVANSGQTNKPQSMEVDSSQKSGHKRGGSAPFFHKLPDKAPPTLLKATRPELAEQQSSTTIAPTNLQPVVPPVKTTTTTELSGNPPKEETDSLKLRLKRSLSLSSKLPRAPAVPKKLSPNLTRRPSILPPKDPSTQTLKITKAPAQSEEATSNTLPPQTTATVQKLEQADTTTHSAELTANGAPPQTTMAPQKLEKVDTTTHSVELTADAPPPQTMTAPQKLEQADTKTHSVELRAVASPPQTATAPEKLEQADTTTHSVELTADATPPQTMTAPQKLEQADTKTHSAELTLANTNTDKPEIGLKYDPNLVRSPRNARHSRLSLTAPLPVTLGPKLYRKRPKTAAQEHHQSDLSSPKIAPLTEQSTTLEFFAKRKVRDGETIRLYTNENFELVEKAFNQNLKITTVLLQKNEIGGAGAARLCDLLLKQQDLKTLCMSSNCTLFQAVKELPANSEAGITDFAGAAAFSRLLSEHRSLEHLKIDECGLGRERAIYICPGLKQNKSLVSLDIRYNAIGDEGIKRICQALEKHPKIQHLLLCANQLTDAGGLSILRLLKANPRITTLEYFEDADSVANPGNEKIENYFSEDIKSQIKNVLSENLQKAAASTSSRPTNNKY
jgi:hypothetical protein